MSDHKLCGGTNSVEMALTGRRSFVTCLNFTTDEKITAKGFKLKWTAKCGSTYTLDHGVITSPHYPDYYPNTDDECRYAINPETPGEKVIVLKVLDLDLSPFMYDMKRSPCVTDYVEISDVTRVVKTYCASQSGEEFEPLAIKGAVSVVFRSNHTFLGPVEKKLRRGFKISYALNACGEEIDLTTADNRPHWTQVTSPAFPMVHHENLNCWWNITTSENRILHVKWDKLDLEPAPGCEHDFVELVDGSNTTKTKSSGRFCGLITPTKTIRTEGNKLSVHFVTDHNVNHGGFKMTITATLGPSEGCGGTRKARADWQRIEAPVDKNGTYVDDLQCGWLIKTDPTKRIELRLVAIDTEDQVGQVADQDRRCNDGLMIYDGYPNSSPALAGDICNATLKKTPLPIYYHTSGHAAYVVFVSDFGGTGRGFTLEYRTFDVECGGFLNATTSEQSIEFDDQVFVQREGRTMLRCRWLITATEAFPVLIKFSNFQFPRGACDTNFVDIRDIGSVSKCNHPACASKDEELQSQHYCGTNRPRTQFIGLSTAVQITASVALAKSDDFDFRFEYVLLPSKHFNLETGRPVEEMAQRRYRDGTRRYNCEFDNVTIQLLTDDTGTMSGYEAYYYSVWIHTQAGIGTAYQFSEISDPQGAITNIGYPNGYPKQGVQSWNLYLPAYKSCTFTVDRMGIDVVSPKSECKDEYLRILTNDDDIKMSSCLNGTLEFPFSFEVEPAARNKATVVFLSDDNLTNDGAGFFLTWECSNDHILLDSYAP
ncbi:unnamed protein product, partial [Mesorhabditis spiculigera]